MKKIKGANMDIDFSKVPGMVWEPGECPWGKEHKCAVKNVSICKYFAGVKYPDVLLCKYREKK